jgi:hypothetical protein
MVLREAGRAASDGHRRVEFWERIATRIGHNRTKEGLHFQTAQELAAALQAAGFARWEVRGGAGRDSNVLWIAWV